MGMSGFYGTGEEDESIATIHWALELGITFLENYRRQAGPGNPRDQVRQRAARRRELGLYQR